MTPTPHPPGSVPDALPAVHLVALRLVAPTLELFGTSEQQQRWLPQIRSGEDVWCQLFSEPGAGSDLASLACRAELAGDGWVVSGQKVWTTMAHVSRWGLLLARTDPEQPKHRGITCFALDMTAPGVEVRPLRQITGDREYNEVFLDAVEVPDAQRIGGVGAGWQVALATLTNERAAGEAFGGGARGSGPIAAAVSLWHQLDPDDRRPADRDRLARLWIEAETARLTAVRAEAQAQKGTPGPVSSIGKIAVSLLHQRIWELAIHLAGPAGLLGPDYEREQGTSMTVAGEEDDLARSFLAVQAMSILGGTSEINRTTIAERVLGLPREPQTDKGTPWSQLHRS